VWGGNGKKRTTRLNKSDEVMPIQDALSLQMTKRIRHPPDPKQMKVYSSSSYYPCSFSPTLNRSRCQRERGAHMGGGGQFTSLLVY
jgi:hypothetical protein